MDRSDDFNPSCLSAAIVGGSVLAPAAKQKYAMRMWSCDSMPVSTVYKKSVWCFVLSNAEVQRRAVQRTVSSNRLLDGDGWFLARARGLPEQCGKRPLVNCRTVTNFNMPHVLPLAFKQSLRIL